MGRFEHHDHFLYYAPKEHGEGISEKMHHTPLPIGIGIKRAYGLDKFQTGTGNDPSVLLNPGF